MSDGSDDDVSTDGSDVDGEYENLQCKIDESNKIIAETKKEMSKHPKTQTFPIEDFLYITDRDEPINPKEWKHLDETIQRFQQRVFPRKPMAKPILITSIGIEATDQYTRSLGLLEIETLSKLILNQNLHCNSHFLDHEPKVTNKGIYLSAKDFERKSLHTDPSNDIQTKSDKSKKNHLNKLHDHEESQLERTLRRARRARKSEYERKMKEKCFVVEQRREIDEVFKNYSLNLASVFPNFPNNQISFFQTEIASATALSESRGGGLLKSSGGTLFSSSSLPESLMPMTSQIRWKLDGSYDCVSEIDGSNFSFQSMIDKTLKKQTLKFQAPCFAYNQKSTVVETFVMKDKTKLYCFKHPESKKTNIEVDYYICESPTIFFEKKNKMKLDTLPWKNPSNICSVFFYIYTMKLVITSVRFLASLT